MSMYSRVCKWAENLAWTRKFKLEFEFDIRSSSRPFFEVLVLAKAVLVLTLDCLKDWKIAVLRPKKS